MSDPVWEDLKMMKPDYDKPAAWIVGDIHGDTFTDFEKAKAIAANYGIEPTPLYLRPQPSAAVVVPELKDTDPEWQDVAFREDGHRNAPIAKAFADGYALAVSRIQPIPSALVLKPGEVAVEREEWETLTVVASRAKDFQNRQRNLHESRDSWGFFESDNALEFGLKRLDTLRSAQAVEPTL